MLTVGSIFPQMIHLVVLIPSRGQDILQIFLLVADVLQIGQQVQK